MPVPWRRSGRRSLPGTALPLPTAHRSEGGGCGVAVHLWGVARSPASNDIRFFTDIVVPLLIVLILRWLPPSAEVAAVGCRTILAVENPGSFHGARSTAQAGYRALVTLEPPRALDNQDQAVSRPSETAKSRKPLTTAIQEEPRVSGLVLGVAQVTGSG